MKRWLWLGICLFSSMKAAAALPTCIVDYEIAAPVYKGGFEGAATLLFLRATSPELDYVEKFPSDEPSIGGNFLTSNPAHHFGFQIMLGYMIPCSGNDLRLTYSDYNTEDNAKIKSTEGFVLSTVSDATIGIPSVNIPAISVNILLAPGFDLDAEVLAPAALDINPNFDEAQVKDIFQHHALDLDFGQYIHVDSFYRLRCLGGLRYAHIRHNFDTSYQGRPIATQTQNTGPFSIDVDGSPVIIFVTTTMDLTATSSIEEFVLQSSDFNGIGPKLGFEGSFHLGGGFGLIGKINTALLVGKKESSLSEELHANFDLLLTGLESEITYSTPAPGVGPVIVPPFMLPDDTPLQVGVSTFPVGNISHSKNFTFPDQYLVVPNVEAKLGIDYTWQLNNCTNISLELGWYINHYFNAIDRLSDVGATQPELRTNHTIDASFNGPYLTLQAQL